MECVSVDEAQSERCRETRADRALAGSGNPHYQDRRRGHGSQIRPRRLLGGKELGANVAKRFELQRITRRIKQEERCLLTGLAREPHVGVNDELDIPPSKTIGERLPLAHLEHDATVRHRHAVSVDRAAKRCHAPFAAERRIQVADELMSVQIEIHPVRRTASLPATEDPAIEASRLLDVPYLHRDVEGRERGFGSHLGQIRVDMRSVYLTAIAFKMDQYTDNPGARWILPATILGSSLGFIDGSVVNVALPALQNDLHASLATVQWIVNGYMLMLASLILPGGSAGDQFGRGRTFRLGLTGFVAASVACAAAPGTMWLIQARLVQGIAAALLVPASLAIVGAGFTGEARGRAIGTWAGAGALTTALGPPLGGWLIDTVGWRAIFLINVPIGALALLFARRIPVDPAVSRQPLDIGGSALAVLSLGLACYGLIALGRGMRFPGYAALAAALVVVVGFVEFERRCAAPMMPLSLFRVRAFAGANALTVLLYAALSAVLFLLPFVLINARGYSAAAAGSAVLPFAIILGFGSRTAGALGARYGAGTSLGIGAMASAGGYALLALRTGDSSYWTGTLPGLVLVAVGMTIAIAPLTTTIFEASPPEFSGIASGINNTAARAGGLIAVAALGLAFGTSDATSISATAVLIADRRVLWIAVALAAASALTAVLTVRRD
jgi:EmrB/QacA subfamily drug resistance transporter